MIVEKLYILFAVAAFCKECVGAFVYLSRDNSTSCVVGFGGLMNILSTIVLPILYIVCLVKLDIEWWHPIVACLSGWATAKILSLIPFLNAVLWMLSYIGLPASLVWLAIEIF